jgi:hypothetical protein
MLFMVIERFRSRDAAAVYRRYAERGRMMPEGLEYVASWVETDYDRCDDPSLFEEWTKHWRDLVEFEIVPVVESKEAREAIAQGL